MSNVHGRFTWYELMSTDPDKAREFYRDVVGWTSMDSPMEGPPGYKMFMVGEMPMAGSMELPAEAQEQGAPSHWIGYIGVDSAEAAVAKTEELGGAKIWGIHEMPEVGKIATLQDPQGAVFAIHEPAAEIPPESSEPMLGSCSWHELLTSDWQAGFDFYHQLFGWNKTSDMDMGENGIYQMYGNATKELGGMMNLPKEMEGAPPCWNLYFHVMDVDAAAERVEAGGGRVTVGPMDVPGGDRVAMCLDPTGGAFSLHAKGAGDGGMAD